MFLRKCQNPYPMPDPPPHPLGLNIDRYITRVVVFGCDSLLLGVATFEWSLPSAEEKNVIRSCFQVKNWKFVKTVLKTNKILRCRLNLCLLGSSWLDHDVSGRQKSLSDTTNCFYFMTDYNASTCSNV